MVAERDHGLGRQRREHGLSNCLSACLRFGSHLSTLRKSSHRLSFAIARRHSKNETTSLHRLDARTCVRADVSDALLRLVDEPGGEEIVVSDWVVEAGRYAARAAVHLFGGRFVRACDGKVAREGNRAQDNREANDSARRGSFWDGVAFSRAGICAGLSVVAVDGSAARRRSKYPGSFHDADGCVVLGHWRWQRLCGENSHSGGRNYCGGNRGHAHPTALDDAPAEVPAVAHRVLHQRRTHLRSAAAVALSVFLDSSSIQLYAVYDYWHSNPDFFLMRCGILLMILFLVYSWCRWGFAQKVFSPIIQLGKTSLLVYWVHIEFVYGRFSILPKGQCSALKATAGLITIFLAMLGLSLARTTWKKWRVRASQ